MNPFKMSSNSGLHNIATGKSTSEKTEDFLLNIDAIGENERDKFIKECKKETRFEERIKRQCIHSFATEAGKKKVKSKGGDVMMACLVRDLFGTLLNLSMDRKIDMEEVLNYPLTPVPLSLCHVDGSMMTTAKSKMLHHLDSEVVTIDPLLLM